MTTTDFALYRREMVAIATYASVLNEGADDEITFFVPKEWAERKVKSLFGMSLDEFFSEYTWDLSESLYHEGRNDEVLLHAIPSMDTALDGLVWVCTLKHGEMTFVLRVQSATEPTLLGMLDSLFAEGQPTVGTLDYAGWCEFNEKELTDLAAIEQYRAAQSTQASLEQLFGPDYNPIYNIVKARLHVTVLNIESDTDGDGSSGDEGEDDGGEDDGEDEDEIDAVK